MITYGKYFYRWSRLLENSNVTFHFDFEIFYGLFIYFLPEIYISKYVSNNSVLELICEFLVNILWEEPNQGQEWLTMTTAPW